MQKMPRVRAAQRVEPGDSLLIRSKLLPPTTPRFAVFRPHLVRRLHHATSKRLVLLVTPPGYGKSVLLSQWAASEQSRRTAWLTVDAADDAHRFARHLCAALEAADGRPRQALLDRLDNDGKRMGEAFITALIADTRRSQPMTLVLEDFHTLADPALVAELGVVIDLASPRFHFVVSTRVDPALPCHRMRLRDEFASIRQDDLVFDRADARALIRQIAHRDLTDHQLDALLERTEGWCAGLQLAALSLRHVPDAERFIREFAGGDANVADYLTEQVLERQQPAVRQFLLRTSVLDRLNGDVCDAVTRGHDGQQMLELLERRSLFTSRLDSHRTWFRYHPLFRTLLVQHLRASDLESEVALLERAATWHLEQDDLETGFAYLARSGRWDRLVHELFARSQEAYNRGRVAALVRWIDQVPKEHRAGRTNVVLLHAALHASIGESLTTAEILRPLLREPSLADAERIVADMISTCSVFEGTGLPTAVNAATRALAGLESVSPAELPDILGVSDSESIRKVCLANRGAAHVWLDEPDAATESLHAARDVRGASINWDTYTSGVLGLMDAWSGRLRRAEQHAGRALAEAQQAGRLTHPSSHAAYLALAHVARERDQLDRATDLLDELSGRLQPTRPSVTTSLCTLERALMALALGEPDRGLAELVQHRASGLPAPPFVARRASAVEIRLLLVLGDLDRAERLLTSEARVAGALGLRTALAVERDDVARARALIDRWRHESTPRETLEAGVWDSIVLDLEGDALASRRRMTEVVAEAEHEGHVRIFLDTSRHALRLLRALYHEVPTPFLRQFVDGVVPVPLQRPITGMIEQLSDRERIVLRYLPSNLSNNEIAERLRVSVNTLKTHLKHIYRKLGVSGRADAIAAAEQLRLL
jgi:LuxR family maltose regulon positive regulatory protein